MKKIGCFRKDGQEFNGRINLVHLEIEAKIVPVQKKASSRSHDFQIFKSGKDSFMSELGIGWQKYSPNDRIPYLDLNLDDPSFPHAINGVLCEGGDGLWHLYWSRVGIQEEMIETLYVQEELKPQLGIRPIANLTLNILRFYPELVPG